MTKNKTINIVFICIVIGYVIPCLKCKGAIKMQKASPNNTSKSISKRQEECGIPEVNLSRQPPGQTTLLDRTTGTSKAPKRTRRKTSKKRTKTIRNTTKVHDETTALFEDVSLKNVSETTESILKAARDKFSQLFKSESIGKSSAGLKKTSKAKIEQRNDTDFLPKLMIFETDRVFWPFTVETDVIPPFGMPRYQPTTKKRRTKTSWWSNINPNYGVELYDRNGTQLRLFPDAPESLIKLYKKGIKMAVAMTTTEIATVRHLLHLFDLDHLFSHMEIDVEPMLNHIIGIKEELGVEFADIVYLGTNDTLLGELKRHLKILTVSVNPERGLNIMHIYKGIYIYNLRPLLSVTKGPISLKGEFVSDEDSEENPPRETISKPTPQKKPRSSSRVKKKTEVKSTTGANL